MIRRPQISFDSASTLAIAGVWLVWLCYAILGLK
jgi:hypothetical protein